MASKGRIPQCPSFNLLPLFLQILRVAGSAEQAGEGPKTGGKKKGKTLPLTDFLKPASVGRWADEDVENDTRMLFLVSNHAIVQSWHTKCQLHAAI